MAKLGPPEKFDSTRPAELPMWRRRFDRYRVATKLDRDSGVVQVNLLLYAIGSEAEAIYDSFVFDRSVALEDDADEVCPENDYDIVIKKFHEHFVPKRNVIHERACFHKLVQNPVSLLKLLSEACMS